MVTGVIVWEYILDDSWINFERQHSDTIEDAFSRDYRGELTFVSDVTTGASVRVNLANMTFLHSTAKKTSPHFIRRNVYNKDSFPGRGIAWQWFCDSEKTWKDYELPVASFLDDSLMRGKAGVLDLEPHFPKHTTIINLINMTQTKKNCSNSTPIRRVSVKPFVSKCLNSTPQSYPRMPPQNFSTSQPVFTQPYPQLNPNVPAPSSMYGLAHPTNVVHHGFSGTNAASQRICYPDPKNIPRMPSKEGPVVSTSGTRKRTHESLPQTSSSSKYAAGRPIVNPGFHDFSTLALDGRNLNSTSLVPCRMSSPFLQQTVGQAHKTCLQIPGPQLQQDLTSKRQSSAHPCTRASSDRRRCRDPTNSTATVAGKESKIVVRTENFTTTFESIAEQQFIIQTQNYPSEDCAICFNGLPEESVYSQSNSSLHSDSKSPNVVYFKTCRHHFHMECLKAMYNAGMKNGSIQCPQCKAIYGIKRGNCPPGDMTYDLWPSSLPGYEGCGTIFIKYFISPGIQGPEHPNPGRPFTTRGFPRCGHLPDNVEGRGVLNLLTKAWKRRLTFTVGCSMTTGESDTVVWNEIHHKTEDQNITGHGYPDPNYLKNVTAELAAHGVSDGDED